MPGSLAETQTGNLAAEKAARRAGGQEEGHQSVAGAEKQAGGSENRHPMPAGGEKPAQAGHANMSSMVVLAGEGVQKICQGVAAGSLAKNSAASAAAVFPKISLSSPSSSSSSRVLETVWKSCCSFKPATHIPFRRRGAENCLRGCVTAP